MTHQKKPSEDKTLSRRTLVQALAAGAGAMVAGAGTAAAQPAARSAAPPSTITTPPRDFGPRGAPTTYFWDPDIIAVDPSFNGLAQPNARDPAAVHRRAVGRRAGMERAGALSRLERHSEQSADALVRGRRPRQRFPHAFEQQQRQHVRLPGPAALLRASHAPRGALRA